MLIFFFSMPKGIFMGQARSHSPHSVHRPARCRAWIRWNIIFSGVVDLLAHPVGLAGLGDAGVRADAQGAGVAARVAADAAAELLLPVCPALFQGHGL